MMHFAQLFQSALQGERESRIRLILETMLVPELEVVLGEHLGTTLSLVPAELDDGGEHIFVDGWTASERSAARRIVDAASTRGEVVGLEDQLDATELIREALADGVEMVERRIAQLHLDIMHRDLSENAPRHA